jgi:serine/threonine protein phosphatase PrpC
VSTRVSCPSCRIICLVAPEHLGKVIRCPGCKQPFSVRPPEPAVPPPLSAIPPARAVRLEIGSATSPGRVRERNEDSHLVLHLAWVTQDGRHEAALAVVADGMGGHGAGDRASAVAIGVLARETAVFLAGLVSGREKGEDEAMLDAVDRALWEANRAVAKAAAEESGCAGMGSTVVAALLMDGRVAVCHVGDCRAYLHRGGALQQLTRDQTLVARMIELGTLTEREARRHPAASQVTQALGKQDYLEPSRQSLDLRPDDRLVLACDGLHAHLDEKALAGVIGQGTDPSGLARTLVERANQAGGSDNCTVVVVWGK